MTERYPDDAALLAIEQDDATGVEFIPTGRSPYYLEFRKMLQRLLLASGRANDLRVYEDGDLTVGVRPGRCVIKGQAISFAGSTQQALDNNQTTSIWLDQTGTLQVGTSGFPTDRTTFVPLAEVTTATGAITQIEDRRGEAFINVPDVAGLGLNATTAEIDQALAGINASVDVAALNLLTGGVHSDADSEHRHHLFQHDEDDQVQLRIANYNAGASANVALFFELTGKLPDVTALLPDTSTGWLQQRYLGQTYALVGALPVQFGHAGDLTATISDVLLGVVPCDGQVTDVILSVGGNIESDTSTDGLTATVSVNGVAVTTTDPQITDAHGSGFRCTDQGDGTAATVKADGTEQVSRGDVLTVTLTRTAGGTISSDARDVVVLVIVRPNGPE